MKLRHLNSASIGAVFALFACAEIAGFEGPSDPSPGARGGDAGDGAMGPGSGSKLEDGDAGCQGGVLEMTPTLIDFGEVRQQTTAAPEDVELENTGNQPLTVKSWAADTANFTITSGPITLGPREKKSTSVTFKAGPAGPQVSAAFKPTTTTALCGDAPILTLKGTRVNQDVTFSPGTVNFGETGCTSSLERQVLLSNFGPSPASANVTFPTDSWFTGSESSITVPPATGGSPGTANITLRLKSPVPPTVGTAHTENVTLHITGAETATKTVGAIVYTIGALVSISPTTLGGFAPGGTRQFALTNNGNKFVYLAFDNSNPDAFTVSSGVGIHSGGNSASASVQFIATANGTYNATITAKRAESPPTIPPLPESGALCNSTPPAVSATATK